MSDGSDLIVTVDWGTSRLRLWACQGSERPVAEVSSGRGIATIRPGEHEAVFLAALTELLASPAVEAGAGGTSSPLDVYFAGMVTSNLGWHPTPYVEVPAGASEIFAAVQTLGETVECGDSGPLDLRMHFFPGLRTRSDIIRGEELEALGLLIPCSPSFWEGAEAAPLDETSGVLVLPGTHSKWIRWSRDGAGERERLVEFVTAPTGDVHAALHRDSLLSRTLPDAPVAIEGDLLTRFDEGLEAASGDGLLASLFQVRSRSVLSDGAWRAEEGSAFLSGLLIGAEVLELLRYARGSALRLGGAPALQALYARAIEALAGQRPLCARAECSSLAVIRAIWWLREGGPAQ